MSSDEQELETVNQENEKADTDSSKQSEKALESEACEDNIVKELLDDLTPKPVESNKPAAFFDDDDDFNSDEMQLRWDDDDDELNLETPVLKDDVKQPEEEKLPKNTDSVNNQSTSLATAVNELENALEQSNNDDVDNVDSKKVQEVGTSGKNDKMLEETETSSKEILDNIDEILGADNSSEKGDDQDNIKMSTETNMKPDEIDDPKAAGDFENSKIDVGETSISETKDIEEKVPEVSKCMDSINLEETCDTMDDSQILSSTINDSIIEGHTKFEHGLKRPDMMLEIPTQEIIDCLDDFDDSDSDKGDDKSVGVDISKQIDSLEENTDLQVMDDEINEDISQIVTKDNDENKIDPGPAVTESVTASDIEMDDNSMKTKISDNIITKEIPETIENENPPEKLSEEVDITSNNDEINCAPVEDDKMEVDESDISGKELTLTHTEDKHVEIDSNTTKEVEQGETSKDSQLSKDTEVSAETPQTIEKAFDELAEISSEISDENKKGEKALTDSDSIDEKIEGENINTLDKNKDEEATLVLDAKSVSDIPEDSEPTSNKSTVEPILDKNTTSEPQTTEIPSVTEMDQQVDLKSIENADSVPDPSIVEEAKPSNEIANNINKDANEDLPKVRENINKEADKELAKESENKNKEDIKDQLKESENINKEANKVLANESDNKNKEDIEEQPKESENKNKEDIKDQLKESENINKEANKELAKESENINKEANKELAKESENKEDIEEQPKEIENINKEANKELAKESENKNKENIDEQPKEGENIIKELPNEEPSTSKEESSLDQIPDTTDEVPEIDDSLGLLAESSRVMEDDEDADEDDDGDGDGDDDDDFDQDDESSNQMTAEHSEDSSAQPDKEDGQTDKEDTTPTAEKKEFIFDIDNVAKDTSKTDMDISIEEAKEKDDVTCLETAQATENDEKDDETEPVAPEETPMSDIETVKLSDTSDNEIETDDNSILKELLISSSQKQFSQPKEISEAVVELAESSSEDEVQEVNKIKEKKDSSDAKRDDTKALPQEDAKPEALASGKQDTESKDDKAKSESKKPVAASTEVYNLDSDDEAPTVPEGKASTQSKSNSKCINPECTSDVREYVTADAAVRSFFDMRDKDKYRVCLACAAAVAERSQSLVNGIKEMTPLLKLDLRKVSSETVEISDSDSDDGENDEKPEPIGESGAKFLEDNLAEVINETWIKYKLDERLTAAQTELDDELKKLEADSKEIDAMLDECQIATDVLRNQLYATFECERRELTPLCIVDTPYENYSIAENQQLSVTTDKSLKRRNSSVSEQPSKRPAIPLGYSSIEGDDSKSVVNDASQDDDKDVSVVKLSVESAPSDLPPPGEIARPPLRNGMLLYAMRNSFCTWVPGKIFEVHPKNSANPFTMCRVRFELKTKIAMRMLSARCLAYYEPSNARLTIGTRVIALSKENVKVDEPNKGKMSFYSGIVAEIPNPVNNYRYLIFFDHGYAQYVHHKDTRVVCESSSLVWEEVHPNSREFVKQYLVAYPERPMVRLHAGQKLKTEWNGKWWITKVLQVDASLVEVAFEDNRTEWIYRGSTRLAPLFLELQAAERHRSRPLPRSNQRRMNMPYVEYTRSEDQNKADIIAAEQTRQQQQQNEELRRQRAVAKKSTALPTPAPPQAPGNNLDSLTSRVVYYTPKNAVKPYKMTAHNCSPKCKRTDVLSLKELKSYNPLAKPLLSGWERQIVRYKGHKEVMYRAPCGRRLRNMPELHDYLRRTHADMAVDLFDFGANTHCLVEFVLNKCLVGKKDLSHGKENVPVPCVNYYDESLPDFCSYNTERTPTAGVPLNLDPEFLCGCDCEDDCQDKSKCACWKLTLEGARTIGLDDNVGYEYKRLPDPLPSGIYECNSRCKCKHTCLNRVAQHPLQLKLQVFKTLNRGWGIRALNDVPKGAFLCVYAGNLLTDATANLDGLNEGDEYLAELDYIEVVEQMKEGYEEDIPNEDKKLDRKASKSSEEESSSEEEPINNKDEEDDDFQPGFIGSRVQAFSKRLRKRDRAKNGEAQDKEKEKGKEIDKAMEDDGCITISDDEEAKEPTKFMAQSGIGANEFVSKYQSVRTLYGKDEACYIMDAKVQGNIGRYLNHSCTPNVFVQNVFVDTHDPRFPWVAFFALSHIRAGTELTWNYNYDVGSVPGKTLYCYCGAPNCRGRLL